MALPALPQKGDAAIARCPLTLAPQRFGQWRGMKPATIICPDCGLVIEIESRPTGGVLIYDVKHWQQRCKRVARGSPVWCLVERDGTYPKALHM